MIDAAGTRLLLLRPKRIEGLPPLAATLLLGIAALSVAAAAATLRTPVSAGDYLLFVALAVPATLTQLFAIFKPRHQVFHAALVFVMAGVLLLPAPLLVFMCVLQHIPDWVRQRYRWYIQSFNICNYVLASLAAVAAAHLAESSPFILSGVAATATFVAVNRVLLATMLWSARGLTPRQTLLFTGEDLWVDLSLAAMGVSFAVLAEVDYRIVPLALAPLVLIYYLERDGRRLEEANETIRRQNESLRERSRAAMEGLAATVDARDAYTAGHSRRVRNISLGIGAELGLPAEDLEILGQAALLHDIGKIAIPDAILLKPGGLAPEEWKVMQTHAEEGARIIERLGFVEPVVPVIRHHHERLDGSGYPDGLRGDEIPLLARIVHLADAFDSMVTTRVYRPRTDAASALAEIRRATGSQFCPDVVAALERALAAGRVARGGRRPARLRVRPSRPPERGAGRSEPDVLGRHPGDLEREERRRRERRDLGAPRGARQGARRQAALRHDQRCVGAGDRQAASQAGDEEGRLRDHRGCAGPADGRALESSAVAVRLGRRARLARRHERHAREAAGDRRRRLGHRRRSAGLRRPRREAGHAHVVAAELARRRPRPRNVRRRRRSR